MLRRKLPSHRPAWLVHKSMQISLHSLTIKFPTRTFVNRFPATFSAVAVADSPIRKFEKKTDSHATTVLIQNRDANQKQLLHVTGLTHAATATNPSAARKQSPRILAVHHQEPITASSPDAIVRALVRFDRQNLVRRRT